MTTNMLGNNISRKCNLRNIISLIDIIPCINELLLLDIIFGGNNLYHIERLIKRM